MRERLALKKTGVQFPMRGVKEAAKIPDGGNHLHCSEKSLPAEEHYFSVIKSQWKKIIRCWEALVGQGSGYVSVVRRQAPHVCLSEVWSVKLLLLRVLLGLFWFGALATIVSVERNPGAEVHVSTK